MHYTLKIQTTDTFQESSVSHNAGDENESIHLEVKGLNAAKSRPENGTCWYVFIPKTINSHLTQKALDRRSVCWDRRKAAQPQSSPARFPWHWHRSAPEQGSSSGPLKLISRMSLPAASTNPSLTESFTTKSLFITAQFREREILRSEDDLGDKPFQCLTVLI